MHEMDLQSVFYILGIVVMSAMLLAMLAIIFLVFYIKTRIGRLQKTVEQKIAYVTDINGLPSEIARGLGSSLIKNILFGRNKRK